MYSEALLQMDRNTVNYMIEDMKKELSEKDNIIAEKDNTIAEKDNTIAEKDARIAELEALLKQQN